MNLNVNELADNIMWGLEHEFLRVDENAQPSRLPHPFCLDDPNITMDFAESQIEIVSDVHFSVDDLLVQIDELKQRVRAGLQGDDLWPFSMPPNLACCTQVPLAYFGDSKEAREAYIYRTELLRRYGLKRQLMSGIHLNFSINPELIQHQSDRNELYLKVTRHLYRNMKFLILLSGASPVQPDCRNFDPVVSVRNSIHGYSRDQYDAFLHLDSLDSYVKGIQRGMRTITNNCCNVKEVLFQSEKEFYAPIRLKRSIKSGASMLKALSEQGIEYLELRFIDINPFAPHGVDRELFELIRLLIIQALKSDADKTYSNKPIIKAVQDARELAGMKLDDMRGGRILSQVIEWLQNLRGIAEEQSPCIRKRAADAIRYYHSQIEDIENLPSFRLNRLFTDGGHNWNSLGRSWNLKKELAV